MHQKSYIEGVLSQFGMEECKPLATPLDVKAILVKPSQEELEEFSQEMDGVPHKAAVGSLMYAMVATRADLAFAVSVVSLFIASPAPLHWMAVKRIMRYLKGTLDVKLCLGGTNMSLHGYCDADWGGDLTTRISTTGYVFFVGDALGIKLGPLLIWYFGITNSIKHTHVRDARPLATPSLLRSDVYMSLVEASITYTALLTTAPKTHVQGLVHTTCTLPSLQWCNWHTLQLHFFAMCKVLMFASQCHVWTRMHQEPLRCTHHHCLIEGF